MAKKKLNITLPPMEPLPTPDNVLGQLLLKDNLIKSLLTRILISTVERFFKRGKCITYRFITLKIVIAK